ncbi:hypothetical protein [Nocardia brasiliensis]|uniref:hypothetical protein n=1 Tax=Nocardia brasiliensis TaxID=37326 RepID=UPI002457675B|nr:hypothetical protein [Nocardia brasiliensis]
MYAFELPHSAEADFVLAEQILGEFEQRELISAGAEFTDLMLTIRATATASLSEGEWVRRIRGAGVPIVAHWSEDDVVTGYGVARPTEINHTDAGKPAVLLDGYLPFDLRLPALRAQWDNRDRARAQALFQWQDLRPSRSFDRESVELTDPALWGRAFTDSARFNEYVRPVPHGNRAEWSRVASRVAGVLALWSRRTEGPAPAALAAAATELGRSAQLCAQITDRPRLESGVLAPDLSLTAIVLAQLNTGYEDPPGESLALLMQLLTTVMLIAKSHRRRGETAEANRVVDACAPLHATCRTLHELARRCPPPKEREP